MSRLIGKTFQYFNYITESERKKNNNKINSLMLRDKGILFKQYKREMISFCHWFNNIGSQANMQQKFHKEHFNP